ncbi:Stress response protein nst1, partial [Tilletia horrida]
MGPHPGAGIHGHPSRSNGSVDHSSSAAPYPMPPLSINQADLYATASDLYRRIEQDPQGIQDDDAYWTSLPAHLRTLIRNALPLGQFPAPGAQDSSGQTTADQQANAAAARHASTQAMIAVAQQLAQAAHASQRHLQQHGPGSNSAGGPPPGSVRIAGNANAGLYATPRFDASIFADLALHPDQALPLHPHPNATMNGQVPGQQFSAQIHYSTGVAQPPSDRLPTSVGADQMGYAHDDGAGYDDDDYYSDEDYEQEHSRDLSGIDHGQDGMGMDGSRVNSGGHPHMLPNGDVAP